MARVLQPSVKQLTQLHSKRFHYLLPFSHSLDKNNTLLWAPEASPIQWSDESAQTPGCDLRASLGSSTLRKKETGENCISCITDDAPRAALQTSAMLKETGQQKGLSSCCPSIQGNHGTFCFANALATSSLLRACSPSREGIPTPPVPEMILCSFMLFLQGIIFHG